MSHIRITAGLLATLVASAGAGSAQAATVSVYRTDGTLSSGLRFSADPGEDNKVTMSRGGSENRKWVVDDGAGNLRTGLGCEPAESPDGPGHRAICEGSPEPTIDLGDGANSFQFDGFSPARPPVGAPVGPVTITVPLVYPGCDTPSFPCVPGIRFHMYYVTVDPRDASVTASGSGPNFTWTPQSSQPTFGAVTVSGTGPGGNLLSVKDAMSRMTGGSGADTLTASGGGQAIITGNAGADTLTVSGSAASSIVGGAGRDRITGGTGPDYVDAADSEIDTVVCGAGIDRVRANRKDSVASDCEDVTIS